MSIVSLKIRCSARAEVASCGMVIALPGMRRSPVVKWLDTVKNTLDHLRVVLVDARNPLNNGAAARAMSNFGVLGLRVVNPYEVACREARSAMGAAKMLAKAEEFRTVAEAVADCSMVVCKTAIGHR